MCTTLLVISTLAILLRRHFFNRVEPHPGGAEEPRQEVGSDSLTRETRKIRKGTVLIVSSPPLVRKQPFTSHQPWYKQQWLEDIGQGN
ncbi:unnamed protein product [Caretta caretta]